MKRGFILLTILLLASMFVLSGCTTINKGAVGQQVGSNTKAVYVYDPKDVVIQTDAGQFKIKSASGPNGEKCNVNLVSLREIIEEDPPQG
ncbi:MAG: hypothetical protein V1663_03095, partial [archaeon]